MSPLLRIRRGLGLLYVMSGLAHWGLMAFAVAVSLNLISARVTGRTWSQLYFGQYLLLVGAGPIYLLLAFQSARAFIPAVLVDFLVGVPPFMILATGVMPYLAAGGNHAAAFLPGAFLLAYGGGLLSGRAIGFRRKAPF